MVHYATFPFMEQIKLKCHLSLKFNEFPQLFSGALDHALLPDYTEQHQ